MTRQLKAEDLYAIKTASDPQVSPDGQRVAFVQTEMVRDKYEYQETIWTIPTAGGEPRRFTTGPHDTTPRWSPDGKRLAFVRAPERTVKPSTTEERDRGVGEAQVWVMPADGGEALKLTWAAKGISNFIWAPDGQSIIYSTRTSMPDDPEAEDAEVTGAHVPHVRTIDRLWYRYEGAGFVYDQRTHLFRIGIDGEGEPQQLTAGDYDDADPALSPDGNRLAFISDRTEERWRWPAPSVWVLDLKSYDLVRVSDEALAASAPSWSPDGKTIAFLASPRRHGTGHTDLYITASDSAGHQRLLTQDFTPTASDSTLDDMRGAHGHAHLAWSHDGREIYFLASMRGTTHVYAAPIVDDLLPRRVTDGNCRTYGFTLDSAGQTFALARSTPTIPGDIYTQPAHAHDLGSQGSQPSHNGKHSQDGHRAPEAQVSSTISPTRLTNVNADIFKEVEVYEPVDFPFRGADGWELQGWVLRPPLVGAGEAVKVPGILEVHGGPHAMYGWAFMFEFQLLAAHGYAVVYTNPRGSTGYGRVFSSAVTNDWGGKDFEDVMAGLDAAVALGGIDPDRLGIAGGSYGGFMTNWAVGHTDRFKAAVTMRSVVNLATMFTVGDVGWDIVDDFDATPWENPQHLAQMSPLTYVTNIHTPLLIIHSEGDLRCPISEAEQLYATLKYLGRTTTFVRFEGQNHDLSRGGHPRSRVIRLEKLVEWFERYLPTGTVPSQTPQTAGATAGER